MRKISFVNGEFYHIYNRGTDKRIVFPENEDLDRFLISMQYFNRQKPVGSIFEFSFIAPKLLGGRTTKLVDIICYCLNPNHFHFILRQRIDGGISEFMKRLGGYTRYINIKYKRTGVLFQGKFKSKHINSNNYLLHASAYVNLNNLVHKLNLAACRSSWDEYSKEKTDNFCEKNIILDQFKDRQDYIRFAKEALENILQKKRLDKELQSVLLE